MRAARELARGPREELLWRWRNRSSDARRVGAIERSRARERNLELLDPRRADFEVDYLVFTRTVLQLETQVQELINRCFETVSRTTSAVRVLEQFKTAFRRGNLEVDLDSKYIYILQVYAKDLEVVRKMYGADKDDPPKPRNDSKPS